MYSESFTVIAVSSNTNSFGLRQFVAVSKCGYGFKACANSLNVPKANEVINVPFNFNDDGTPVFKYGAKGYELPEILTPVPTDVLNAVFGTPE